jgi:uncharacterized Tic20 family protein
MSSKDKVRGVTHLDKDLLNFQITWVFMLFLAYAFIFISSILHLRMMTDISIGMFDIPEFIFLFFLVGMYLYNFIAIISNTLRIHRVREVKYPTLIKLIRN